MTSTTRAFFGVASLTAALIALPASAEARAADCSTTSVRHGSRGACALEAQTALADHGFYAGRLDGVFGQASVNAVLNYQRAHKLRDDGAVGTATWSLLRTAPQPRISTAVPRECRTRGVVLCVGRGVRKLMYFRDGQLLKSAPIRVAGMTRDDHGRLKIYRTIDGVYRVYGKQRDAYSARWRAAMPYSIKFDPGMYVHYSGDFAKRGYASASHGCVNLRSRATAKWFYDHTPIGAKVVVFT